MVWNSATPVASVSWMPRRKRASAASAASVASASGPGLLLEIARVIPTRIAVPDIDRGVGQRLAGGRVVDQDLEFERRAGTCVGDVLADQVAIQEIGSLGQLRGEHAGIGGGAGSVGSRRGAVLREHAQLAGANSGRGCGAGSEKCAPAGQHIGHTERASLAVFRVVVVRLVHTEVLQNVDARATHPVDRTVVRGFMSFRGSNWGLPWNEIPDRSRGHQCPRPFG